MNGFSIEESKGVYGAKIKVIGVGGGGGLRSGANIGRSRMTE